MFQLDNLQPSEKFRIFRAWLPYQLLVLKWFLKINFYSGRNQPSFFKGIIIMLVLPIFLKLIFEVYSIVICHSFLDEYIHNRKRPCPGQRASQAVYIRPLVLDGGQEWWSICLTRAGRNIVILLTTDMSNVGIV